MANDNIAPAGAIWVCRACGKQSHDLYGIEKLDVDSRSWDESCMLNAVLCVDDKPPLVSTFDHKWTAWQEDGRG